MTTTYPGTTSTVYATVGSGTTLDRLDQPGSGTRAIYAPVGY